jgi:hypothetical protein
MRWLSKPGAGQGEVLGACPALEDISYMGLLTIRQRELFYKLEIIGILPISKNRGSGD